MATLEKIIYNQDTGTEAIQKLDRNQRKINDDVKIINMDGVNQQLTDLTSRDVAQQQQINSLNDKLSNFDVIPLFSGGVGGGEGGEIHIEKPQTSNLTSHITIDAHSNFLRFYTLYNGELRGVKVNFSELTKNEIQDLATTKFVDLSDITFLNGFARYADTSFGCISKSGKNVHINILLSCNGVPPNTICILPFVPAKNEIHHSEGIQFRTYNDGRLVCEGSLPNTGGYLNLDINYTCIY